MHTLHVYAEKCFSNHKRDEFVKKQRKIYYKGSRIYMYVNFTAQNKKLFWEIRSKAKKL